MNATISPEFFEALEQAPDKPEFFKSCVYALQQNGFTAPKTPREMTYPNMAALLSCGGNHRNELLTNEEMNQLSTMLASALAKFYAMCLASNEQLTLADALFNRSTTSDV